MYPIDIVTVLNINSKGWILEKIANLIVESLKNQKKEMLVSATYYLINGSNFHGGFPAAKVILFMHYKPYFKNLGSLKFDQSPILWFTHHEAKHHLTLADLSMAINLTRTLVLTPCELNRQALLGSGVFPDLVNVVYGGYPDHYIDLEPIWTARKRVCFVGACYERKKPDLFIKVAKANPNIEFLIIGPNADEIDNQDLLWSQSLYSDTISSTPNIKLIEARYSQYQKLMSECQVYLSLSSVEGGPIGLVEAMSLGLIPIATDTGFAPELLSDLSPDLLLEHDINIDRVSKALRLAFSMAVSVGPKISKHAVKNMSWSKFGNVSAKLINNHVSVTSFAKCCYAHQRLLTFVNHYIELDVALRKSIEKIIGTFLLIKPFVISDRYENPHGYDEILASLIKTLLTKWTTARHAGTAAPSEMK